MVRVEIFFRANRKSRSSIAGNVLQTQLIPIAPFVLNIPGRNSSATVELVFLAEDLPPLGYKSYHISKEAKDEVTEGIYIEKDVTLALNDWVRFLY